jgi:hypothetical protein
MFFNSSSSTSIPQADNKQYKASHSATSYEVERFKVRRVLKIDPFFCPVVIILVAVRSINAQLYNIVNNIQHTHIEW